MGIRSPWVCAHLCLTLLLFLSAGYPRQCIIKGVNFSVPSSGSDSVVSRADPCCSDNTWLLDRSREGQGPGGWAAFWAVPKLKWRVSFSSEDTRGNSWGLGVAFHGFPILLFLIFLHISISTYILFSPVFIESGKLKTKALYQFPLIIFSDFIEIGSLLRNDGFWLVLRLILGKKKESNNHYLFSLLLCFQPSSHLLSWAFRWYKFCWLSTVSFSSPKKMGCKKTALKIYLKKSLKLCGFYNNKHYFPLCTKLHTKSNTFSLSLSPQNIILMQDKENGAQSSHKIYPKSRD